MDILPQKATAEGVHGFNIRLINAEQLAAQMVVFRLLRHSPGKLFGDLAPQLGGGSAGIGDDEEIVYAALFLLDPAKQALHQHLGLAGAGRRRHQQAAAAVFHGLPLLLREPNVTHGAPPFPFRLLWSAKPRQGGIFSDSAGGLCRGPGGNSRRKHRRTTDRRCPGANG